MEFFETKVQQRSMLQLAQCQHCILIYRLVLKVNVQTLIFTKHCLNFSTKAKR